MTTLTKKCPSCIVKSANEFYSDNSKPDGLSAYCKACREKTRREKRIAKQLANPKPPRITEWPPETLKVCTFKEGCVKPISEFYKAKAGKYGVHSYCKECAGEFQRLNIAKRVEKYKPVTEGHKYCAGCKQDHSVSDFTPQKGSPSGLHHYCRVCQAKKRQEMRYEVLCHYSDADYPRCECCHETILEFLSIDHIHGGGGKERKQIRGTNYYGWLRSHGLPAGMRVLCHNCNQSFGFYGYCPHQREETHLCLTNTSAIHPPSSNALVTSP